MQPENFLGDSTLQVRLLLLSLTGSTQTTCLHLQKVKAPTGSAPLLHLVSGRERQRRAYQESEHNGGEETSNETFPGLLRGELQVETQAGTVTGSLQDLQPSQQLRV